VLAVLGRARRLTQTISRIPRYLHTVASPRRSAFLASRYFAYLRVASALHRDTSMTDPTSSDKTPEGEVVHTFTVLRGMAIAVVIETRDWYSGLLQAALARVRIEGQN
jgi:hypothetical protein